MRDDDNEDDDEYTPGSERDSGGSSDDSMSEAPPPPKKSRKTKQGSGKARRKLKRLKPVKHTPVLLGSNELRRTSLLEDLDAPSASKPWEVPSVLAAIKKHVRDVTQGTRCTRSLGT